MEDQQKQASTTLETPANAETLAPPPPSPDPSLQNYEGTNLPPSISQSTSDCDAGEKK